MKTKHRALFCCDSNLQQLVQSLVFRAETLNQSISLLHLTLRSVPVSLAGLPRDVQSFLQLLDRLLELRRSL